MTKNDLFRKGINMDRAELLHEMGSGRNCAQIVCGAFADETGYDTDETDRVAKNFGGGMMMGHTCGAVTGGLMALGLMDTDREKAMEFERRFKEKFGSCTCFELLGNMTAAQAREAGKIQEVCPGYIAGAIEIIEEMLS